MARKESHPGLMADAVIKAAYDVFAEKGYSTTNLQDIADRLGTTRTPIYYYFHNKYQLYCSVALQHLNAKEANCDRILNGSGNIFDRLRRHMYFSIDFGLKEANFFREINYNHDLFEIKSRYLHTSRVLFDIKSGAIQEAVRQGELRPDTDVNLYVLRIYVLYNGVAAILDKNSIPITKKMIRSLVDSGLRDMERDYSAGSVPVYSDELPDFESDAFFDTIDPDKGADKV